MSSRSGFVPFSSADEESPSRLVSSVDPRLSRTNYFDGRLLRASDLTRDQFYLDERLREVGRVLGQGIVRGLEADLSADGVLSVSPGLAVSPSGRVLELAAGDSPAELRINLFDSALIRSLNPDMSDRLETGLYVVAVRYAARGDGVAEVFPTDLAGERGFHFNAFEEGIELFLEPLRSRVPVLTSRIRTGLVLRRSRYVNQRAGLVRDLIANPGQPPEIGDDAVALGLLAIDLGQPVWLDRGLVGRAHRDPAAPYQWQQDLSLHYEELLTDVLEDRTLQSRTGPFQARSYFQVLPPAGRLPAETVDPADGLQSYFPDHFDIEIAPVRQDDLPVMFSEASALDPIDLSDPTPVSIMVLAPLPDGVFAHFARQIEFHPLPLEQRLTLLRRNAENAIDFAVSEGVNAASLTPVADAVDGYSDYIGETASASRERVPSLDSLTLRLSGRQRDPVLDTDTVVWGAIHAAVQENGGYWFMRRPPRAAETGVSAIVVARGYEPPEPGTDPALDTEALEEALAEATGNLEAANETIGTLEEQIDDLEDQIDEFQNSNPANDEIAQLRERLRVLTDQLDSARAQAALVPQLQADVADLQAQLADALGRNTDLGNDLTAARGALTTAQNTIQTQNTELATRQGRINALSADVGSRDRQITTLQAEVARQAGVIDVLEEQLRGRPNPRSPVEPRIATDPVTDGTPVRRVTLDTLRVQPVTELVSGRDIAGDRARAAAADLAGRVEGNDDEIRVVNFAASLVPSTFDSILWTTLLRVIDRGRTSQLEDILVRASTSTESVAMIIAASAGDLQLTTAQRRQWLDLAMADGN